MNTKFELSDLEQERANEFISLCSEVVSYRQDIEKVSQVNFEYLFKLTPLGYKIHIICPILNMSKDITDMNRW